MRILRTPRVLLAAGCVAAVMAGAVIAADRSASAMRSAASAFLASLTAEQRATATFDFDSAERTRWNFIPPQAFPRKGLTFKAMTEAQREKAHALLKTGLSQRGYMTAASIMDLENTLGGIERAARGAGLNAENFPREPLEYYVSVFGTPSEKGTWGWRVEGHHVSIRFALVDGNVDVGAPSFFGSNPAEVREGPRKGLRILAHEEDPARALVTALDAAQRAKGVIQDVAPNDIVTGSKVDINPLSPVGITAADLNPPQRQMLMQVVDAYTSAMAPDIAADRMNRLTKAGVDKIAFAWAGELERGKKHYYRVQGPTFLIEFDNTQNNGNHIHSVWRDFNGDFGRDLLREHLKNTAH
jgi:Protein of unknown function (DUF3500)